MFSPQMLNRADEIHKELLTPYVVIENALIPEKAEELYQELVNTDLWKQVKVQQGKFSSCRENIPIPGKEVPPRLKEFYKTLVSKETRDWFSRVCEKPCDAFNGAATNFKRDDYIALHTDRFIHEGSGGARLSRSLTFNYYLTKDWNPEWGGNFYWKRPASRVVPGFNTLVLFLLSRHSAHWVDPIATDTDVKRLGITGWYVGELSKQRFALSI